MKLEPVSYLVEEDSDDYGAISSDEEQIDDTLLQSDAFISRGNDVMSRVNDVTRKGEEDDDFEKEMNEEIEMSMSSVFQKKPSEDNKLKAIQEKPKFYDDIYFNSSDEEDTRSVSDKRIQTNEELLYDPSLDDRNEKWVQKKRKNYLQPGSKAKTGESSKEIDNSASSATLACPACMTVLCRDCQQHETYHEQFRAMFVFNCLVLTTEELSYKLKEKKKRRRKDEEEGAELYNPVKCVVCETKVGVFDKEEVYHFFNVLAT